MARVCDAVCKTRNHCASHERLLVGSMTPSLSLPTAFGGGVLVFKEGPFWFWNLNLSNDTRDPCQNLEANSSIFRTDPLCQWHSNEKQKIFQKFLNFLEIYIKFKCELNSASGFEVASYLLPFRPVPICTNL